MRRYLVLIALALGACGQPRDTPAKSQAPADAPANAAPEPAVDLSVPIRALGNEPFWAVEVGKDTLVLTRPDHRPMTVRRPNTAAVTTPRVMFGDLAAFSLLLEVGECSDGMSDRRYPYKADLIVGGETLHGCAAPVSALTPEGK